MVVAEDTMNKRETRARAIKGVTDVSNELLVGKIRL